MNMPLERLKNQCSKCEQMLVTSRVNFRKSTYKQLVAYVFLEGGGQGVSHPMGVTF